MIGIDTNILVRHMVQDDAEQARLASELIESCSNANPASLPLLVLCETVWVLSSAYGFSRAQISRALQQILQTEGFDIEAHELAWNALFDYRDGGADFADGLLARINRQRGSTTTYTFDKRAARMNGFTLLAKKGDQG